MTCCAHSAHTNSKRKKGNAARTMVKWQQPFGKWALFLQFLLLLTQYAVYADDEESSSSAFLFTPSKEYSVMGPDRFPKPTDMVSPDAVVAVQPTFGRHRPEKDAVLAYAEGYPLENYLYFVESLLKTGFDGDIVLAIASIDTLQEGVEEYLRSKPTVVAYSTEFFTCNDNKLQSLVNRTQDGGGKMSFQMCKLDGIYGIPQAGRVQPVPDPRNGRVVATSRYELYWIWALHYQPHSWLMLLDARDAFFQQNPFLHLPRTNPDETTSASILDTGMLYFFGENANATRLGKSPKNRKWLERAYSPGVMEFLREKPTICSGSTMGEQIALEAYLRAMVNEWDETHIFMKGADQGFHNYLYYTNKLQNVRAIRSIRVFEQGKGIINNLGALRKLKLSDLGLVNSNTREVYNWDGSLSPVVHQWDRDAELFHYTESNVLPRYRREWSEYLQRSKALE